MFVWELGKDADWEREAAEAYLMRMEKEGRFRQETW
jgi:sulfite reductase alpha subunit-like flavoprotein